MERKIEEKGDEKLEEKEVKPRCEDEERVGEDRSRGLKSVNWIELLDEASELPCDITFEILDNSFSGSNGEKKTVIGEIGAHKCFHGGVRHRNVPLLQGAQRLVVTNASLSILPRCQYHIVCSW